MKPHKKKDGIKESLKDMIQLGPMTILGYHKTSKECPKCGSKLNIHVTMTQLYVCSNCGYRGPVSLNPKESKEKDKKKFDEAVKTLKRMDSGSKIKKK